MTNLYTDLVYSPDDGGYYFHEFHPTEIISRVSKLYPTRAEAKKADASDMIVWEEWD